MANNNESVSLNDTETESMIMNNVEIQSTPTTTRIKELSVDDVFNLIKTMSESINNNFDKKFNTFDEKSNKLDVL